MPPSRLSAKRTEHSVVFAVTDSGPGIPPDVKDKVFDWFESHSNGSRHRGAGLGLPLVKLVRRTARRQGARRFDRRQGHDRHVRLSDRSGRPSQRRGMNGPTTFSLALANETATAHLMADLALADRPRRRHHPVGRPRRRQDRRRPRHDPVSRRRRHASRFRARPSRSRKATICRRFRWSMPISTASTIPLELEEIGLSPLPEATVALIEWPERAAGALPQDRIDIALSHRPALGSTARAAEITGYGKAAAQVARLQGAAAVSGRRRLCRRQAPAHARRRLHAFLCAAGPRRRRGHPDELAAASRRPGDL